MRIGFVILCLGIIGASLVELRQEEMRANYEARQLQGRRLTQRRTLWDQDVRMGELRALERVQARAEDMGVSMLGPGEHKIIETAGAFADAQKKSSQKPQQTR